MYNHARLVAEGGTLEEAHIGTAGRSRRASHAWPFLDIHPRANPAKYQEELAKGRKLWFYVCNANFPPSLGYDVDTSH